MSHSTDNQAKPRILIVDDERSIRLGFAAALQSKDWVVDSEGCPLMALELLKEKRYDGMILDLLMPAMDGLTLAQKQSDLGIICPTILASAMATTDHVISATRAGIVDFLSKPPELEDLRIAVRHLLWRRSHFQNLPLSTVKSLSPHQQYECAKYYIQQRDFRRASQILQEGLQQQPDEDLEMLLALVAEVERRYEVAEKHYGRRFLARNNYT